MNTFGILPNESQAAPQTYAWPTTAQVWHTSLTFAEGELRDAVHYVKNQSGSWDSQFSWKEDVESIGSSPWHFTEIISSAWVYSETFTRLKGGLS